MSLADPSTARQPVAFATAWKGDELFERDDFLHEMTEVEVDEVRAALAQVDASDLDLEAITPETFPLPTLSKRLATMQESLEYGSGAVLLRGWPAADFDVTDNERVHWGISRHLGTPVSQSARGERIFHVANKGYQPSDPRDRGPNSARALRFHSDRCDVLGFLCVRPAQAGSVSQREALDLVDELCADPEFHARFRQETGDILFANNFTTLHSRSEFEDHPDPKKRRLILRIWLAVPNSRRLPPELAGTFGATEPGAVRGGIHPTADRVGELGG